MAVKHLVAAFEMDVAWDTASQRTVYLEMTYWADRKGVIRMSQKELAERTVLSRRTVVEQTYKLIEMGLIAKIAHSRYALRYGKADETDETDNIEAEVNRLREIRQPHQAIVFTREGKPRLVDRD